jgi:hypothetical protein
MAQFWQVMEESALQAGADGHPVPEPYLAKNRSWVLATQA